MRIASMPMYDMPEVREALDTLWTGLAHNMKREGVPDVPGAIVHGRTLHDLWSDPRPLFSQCCGYDIVHRYARKLRPIATQRYGAPDCRGSGYASFVVVAEDCEKGRRHGYARLGMRHQRLGITFRHECVTGIGGPVEPQRQILLRCQSERYPRGKPRDGQAPRG